MNLTKINNEIDSFLRVLKEDRSFDWVRMSHQASRISDIWDVEASDMSGMYLSCFDHYISQWWRSERPAMLTMSRYCTWADDVVRSMIKDLLREGHDITGRIGRFVHHCDMLYKDEKRRDLHAIGHYHGDLKMIFHYLSTLLPDLYMPYDFKGLDTFLDLVGSKQRLVQTDIDRYVKVSKTLCSLVQRHEPLSTYVLQVHGELGLGSPHWMMVTYLLVTKNRGIQQ